MRDQGRDNGSLIVSIPNLNGKKLKITKHKKPVVDSNTILDQELDLLPKDKPTLQARVINREFAGFFSKKVKFWVTRKSVKLANNDEERTVLADGQQAPAAEKPSENEKEEEETKEKEKPDIKKPSIKWSDLIYRDPCKHWCQTTQRWLTSFPVWSQPTF